MAGTEPDLPPGLFPVSTTGLRSGGGTFAQATRDAYQLFPVSTTGLRSGQFAHPVPAARNLLFPVSATGLHSGGKGAKQDINWPTLPGLGDRAP